MNKYLTHILAFAAGSSLAYASPQTLFKTPDVQTPPSKPMCVLSDIQDEQCETDEPKITPAPSSSKNSSHSPDAKELQRLIEQEIIREMTTLTSWQKP